MDLVRFFLKVARKAYRKIFLAKNGKIYTTPLFEERVEFFDQAANDLLTTMLSQGAPLMVSKFGTIELFAIANFRSMNQSKYDFRDYYEYVLGKRCALWWNDGVQALGTNAGFFPIDNTLLPYFHDVYVDAMQKIDVLGSYLIAEKFFDKELAAAKRINIDGYYAPFFYDNPWTKILAGKKVLVIHPFEDSIRSQYRKRRLIWENPDLLPEFELLTIKAVQTIAGEESSFINWFEALESMKNKVSQTEFDIALIGCGAYGMPLAAHVKKMGKQAVHLAGWLQVLFGIKGKRWTDDPRVAKLMNDSWEFPLPSEVPKKFRKVEDGCYW
ncbi:hypothetical protein [Noviherbaspirillum soli]|uniref:hypothetical protein n=1 Tax=Noviherbaspirillum soli TaxID=1064518 RepID=UPI00188ADFCE|nr:hypothetical protein [Noviherbaspirillum soli]